MSKCKKFQKYSKVKIIVYFNIRKTNLKVLNVIQLKQELFSLLLCKNYCLGHNHTLYVQSPDS